MKKILSYFIILALLVIVIPVQHTYASSISTPNEYVEYLKMQPNSSTAISQFNSLSAEDQQKFIEYVTDPALMQVVLDSTLSGESSTLKNGDIKINQPSFGIPHTGGGSIGTMATVRTPYQDFDSTILGVNLFTYRVTLTYSVAGTSNANLKVTKAISGGGSLLHSYIPGLSMSFTNQLPFVKGNTAQIIVQCHWDVFYEGSGARAGTDIITLVGYPDGSTSWSRERT